MKAVAGLAVLFGIVLSAEAPAEEATARNREVMNKSSAPTGAAQPSRPRANTSLRTTSGGGDQLSSEQGARMQESLQKHGPTERMMGNSAKKASDTTEFITKGMKN